VLSAGEDGDWIVYHEARGEIPFDFDDEKRVGRREGGETAPGCKSAKRWSPGRSQDTGEASTLFTNTMRCQRKEVRGRQNEKRVSRVLLGKIDLGDWGQEAKRRSRLGKWEKKGGVSLVTCAVAMKNEPGDAACRNQVECGLWFKTPRVESHRKGGYKKRNEQKSRLLGGGFEGAIPLDSIKQKGK